MSKTYDGDTKLPNSYQENTRQEIQILKLADNFHRQFKYLYPDRIKPPLYLDNECNVTKLTCTYLCPLKVAMPTELRKWDFCANFFADYLDYELLQPQMDCPQKLSSVENILKWKKGNSLELSIVLCTFLLAADYDAYVVQGYARRNICEKLENSQMKPPIRFDTNSEYHKVYFTSTEQEETPKFSKYQLNFELVKAFWVEGKSMSQIPDKAPKEADVEVFEEDTHPEKKIHFWVLICNYEKDNLRSFFIEPTTGEKKSVDNLNYLGIEFAWNHKNFWCNNQHSDGSCKDIKYYFDDSSFWEAFILEYSITEEYETSIRMPGAWGREIEITMENLKNRFPPQGRQIHYKKAKVEKYNPGALKDNLIYRMTYYKTKNKNYPIESHAFFMQRNDFLEYRMTDFEKQLVEDVFSPGRPDSMKQHEYSLKGMSSFPQKMTFYSFLRKDQLSSRTWTSSVTVDEFAERSDFLTKREVHYLSEDIYPSEVTDEARIVEEAFASDKPSETLKEDSAEIAEKDIKPSKEKVASSEINLEEEASVSENKKELTVEASTNLDGEVKKNEEAESVPIAPSSFDASSTIFEDVNFNSWTLEFFLKSIDPCERYATSESETEDRSRYEDNIDAEHRTYEAESTETDAEKSEKDQQEKEQIPQDVDGTTDEDKSEVEKVGGYSMKLEVAKEESSDPESEIKISSFLPVREDHEPTKEGDFDKEMELYDEINFDALSDDELEIDYQLYLSKLWEEYINNGRKELFYMTREFYHHKDLRSKETLKLKKKIIRKRRKNVRYLQQMESGKPSVRNYKKCDEGLERKKSIYTNDLINYLNLQENLGIENASSLEEFHLIEKLEKVHVDAANAELIKREYLKLLDKKLKNNKDNKTSSELQNFQLIKISYRRDPSLPVEQAIRHIWFDIETDSYRIDFHYPEGESSRKILFFIKPENNTTDFTFSDYLCRQILPSYETKHTKRPQLYSYLVAAMKKESLVWRELLLFENEMEQVLEKRRSEEKATKVSHKKILSEIPDKALHFRDSEEDPTVSEEAEETKDIISYAISKLNLSLPLSADDGEKLYDGIFDEFCNEAFLKCSDLEKEYKNVTEDWNSFLGDCKTWKEATDAQELLFVEVCGKFSALISSIKFRCDAQREATKSNFIYLKKKLYYDPRLQAYIAKAKESQKGM